MKPHTRLKSKGTTRVNNQQVIFELKHRVVVALNKLADRDTYQVGVDELEKVVECLTPEGISLFLSCILDTASEQKTAVRKECIRLMATLATFHEDYIGQHLGKMVSSVVKRLKDQDSVVRDACVETVGVLASKMGNREGEGDGVFVVLVKPLFEALGEQSRQVQSGSALCLARIIDNTHDPPISILQRMLTRTSKLLKNPHFMAKSAVIELNRSIIQDRVNLQSQEIISWSAQLSWHINPQSWIQAVAKHMEDSYEVPVSGECKYMVLLMMESIKTSSGAGGAPSQDILSAAMTSIREALKSSDWPTRKAASIALGEIASSGGAFMGSCKASCIRSLELCRFDKVKPVRDTVLQALHYWRTLPGADTPEPSEAGSSFKENFGCDYGDLSSASDSGRKYVAHTELAKDSVKQRIPLSDRKPSQNYVKNHQGCKPDNWQIEIAVPKTLNVSFADAHLEESECGSVTNTKTLERMSADVTSTQDTVYEYIPMDDKQECSSVSNGVTNNFETKFVTVSHDCLEENSLMKPMRRGQCFSAEEISSEEQIYSARMRDRQSLDSTVTVSSSQTLRACCLQTTNEMVSIRKQLLEIENKQSNLMDLLQVFTTSTMDSLSLIQSKVLALEHVVDRIAQDVVHGGRYSDSVSSKLLNKSQSFASPRLSTCTPRPSVDIRNRPAPSLSMENAGLWEEKSFGRTRSSTLAKQDIEMWKDSTAKISRNPTGKGIPKNSSQGQQNMDYGQMRKVDLVFASASNAQVRQTSSESKNSLWKRIKGFLFEGDLDSAYVEALCSRDELVLIELLDRTGPALESLSRKTVGDLLGTVASYFLEQRNMKSIIPWLQQVVDLSTIHGLNYLALSEKARRDLLSAIQEAVNMEFPSLVEKRSVSKLAMELHQIWGKSF